MRFTWEPLRKECRKRYVTCSGKKRKSRKKKEENLEKDIGNTGGAHDAFTN